MPAIHATPQNKMWAGLLAKAVVQSHYLVTDTPPSRASPLPQFDLGFDSGFAGQGLCGELHAGQAMRH